MATQLELSSLDFDKNKQEFISFLRTKPEFTDANFDGSNINYLLDTFAYNSTFFGYLANSTYNETTLDTVAQRKNALSIAHDLSYDIDRAIPATASVTVTLVDKTTVTNKIPSFDFSLNTLVLPKFTQFNSANGVTFITEQDYVLSPENGYMLTFEIREGAVIEDEDIGISDESVNQKFRVDVDNIADILTELRVNGVVWDNIQDITVYTSTSQYYQIKENFRETYDFIFGDGNLGEIPVNNSAITLTYMITGGTDGNSENNFTLVGSVFADGIQTPANEIDNTAFSTNTLVNSAGGRDKESIEDIRRAAPRWYAAQARAITQTDYEVILRKHQFVEYLNVYGGETLNPPIYGFVYATIKPPGADALTPEQEDSITAYIDQFNIESIRLRIRAPLFINVVLNVSVNFNLRTSSQGTILSAVRAAIQEYFVTQNSESLGFFYSGVLCDISEINDVISVNMTTTTYTTLQPSVDGVYFLNFGQSITEGSINLTFNDTSGWSDDNGDIIDKDDGSVIGTINYQTGVISVFDYIKLTADTNLFFTITSGNVGLFQNILIRYDELGSKFEANGIFK